jgi:hypothetical protein
MSAVSQAIRSKTVERRQNYKFAASPSFINIIIYF